MKTIQVNVMTTDHHLNEFIELDSETMDELSKTADELLEFEHLDFDNTNYLAKALFCLGRYDESIKQFERMLSLKSDDWQVMADIGINYFKKKDYETAIKYFSESLENNPDNETALSYKMLSHEFLKDYPKAIDCGERILKNNSKNTSVINHLIDCHLKLKNYDVCYYYINRADYKDLYKKASILYESKRYEECIKTSVKLKTAESNHLTGKAHHKLGNTLKAVKYLFKSYEKDPNIDILFEISDIYSEVWDYPRSIHFLKIVLTHDESNIKAHSRIALAYLDSSNWHDAVEYAEKALEISKKVPQAYVTLAEAYFQIGGGDFEKPKQIIDEGISENPNSAELWVKKGDYNYPYDMFTFSDCYEKAISLSPSDYSIYKEYIRLLLLEEEDETAKKYYNQMLFVNPLFEKSFEEFKKSTIWW